MIHCTQRRWYTPLCSFLSGSSLESGLGFLCLTVMVWTGCNEAKPEKPRYPDGLIAAAHAFASKDPSNRYSEATNLLAALPKCPITSRGRTFMGHGVSYDYSKPSYVLRRSDVARLVGPPSSIESDVYNYRVEDKQGAHWTWYMFIQFDNDRVVYANLFLDHS